RETLIYVPANMGDRRVYMERSHNVEQGDSGWFVGPTDRKAAESEMVARPTFELLRLRPALLDVLPLPPGYLVVWDGDGIEAIVGPDEKNAWRAEMSAARATWPRAFPE